MQIPLRQHTATLELVHKEVSFKRNRRIINYPRNLIRSVSIYETDDLNSRNCWLFRSFRWIRFSFTESVSRPSYLAVKEQAFPPSSMTESAIVILLMHCLLMHRCMLIYIAICYITNLLFYNHHSTNLEFLRYQCMTLTLALNIRVI